MSKTRLLCASLVAAFASLGLSAHAQDGDRDHDRYNRYEQRDPRSYDQRSHDNRWADRRDRDARTMGGFERHNWRRGDRLPDEYYRHQGNYVDWRARHLHAPPRGYQWVQVDGDYVLVAIASGLIADLIINSR